MKLKIYKFISFPSLIILFFLLASVCFKYGYDLKTTDPTFSSWLINISASFLVLVITIFFIEILLHKRRENEWKKVKKLVVIEINENIKSFINSLENIFKEQVHKPDFPDPDSPEINKLIDRWVKDIAKLKTQNYKDKLKPKLIDNDLLITTEQTNQLYNVVEKLKNENTKIIELFNTSLEPNIYEKLILLDNEIESILIDLELGKYHFASKNNNNKYYPINFMGPSNLKFLLNELEKMSEEIKKLNLDIYGQLDLNT